MKTEASKTLNGIRNFILGYGLEVLDIYYLDKINNDIEVIVSGNNRISFYLDEILSQNFKELKINIINSNIKG